MAARSTDPQANGRTLATPEPGRAAATDPGRAPVPRRRRCPGGRAVAPGAPDPGAQPEDDDRPRHQHLPGRHRRDRRHRPRPRRPRPISTPSPAAAAVASAGSSPPTPTPTTRPAPPASRSAPAPRCSPSTAATAWWSTAQLADGDASRPTEFAPPGGPHPRPRAQPPLLPARGGAPPVLRRPHHGRLHGGHPPARRRHGRLPAHRFARCAALSTPAGHRPGAWPPDHRPL